MKFGKALLSAQWTPWADVYIPYKQLKKILKMSRNDPARYADMEGAFVACLVKAVQSVDSFFETQEQILSEQLNCHRVWCGAPPSVFVWCVV